MQLKNFTEEDIQRTCEKYFKLKYREFIPLTVVSHQCKAVSEVPIGFLASHCFLDVRVKIEKNGKYKNLQFFIKTLPHYVDQHTNYIQSFRSFEKETSLYELLIPTALSVSSAKWVADCYLTNPRGNLVFENLGKSGYRMASSPDGRIDLNHLIVAMKALAVMHASWMILQRQENQSMQAMYIKNLYENAYPPTDEMPMRTAWVKNSIVTLQELVKYIPKYSDRYNEIGPKFAKQLERIFELCKPSTRYRNVFNHGDLWQNNIMYRYDTEDTPVQAVFVDFQLSRLAPPALDFMTLLTMVTDSAVRSEYFQHCFNAYYDQLEMELSLHNLSVRNELSFNEFLESCKYYRLAALIEACMFHHLILLHSDLTKTILDNSDNFEKFAVNSRIEICLQAFKTDENYRYRMSDNIEEIIDNFVVEQ